jgi:hypothetical protein|tara:strand:+ start:463 stop:663 length:201 start_codon:yes stop_codon:yes gene_type:complete
MNDFFETATTSVGWILFVFADIATFIYLMVVDWPDVNAWNWIIIIPVNVFLATIWPIYWGILHWIF